MMTSATAVIVAAKRTPIGRRGGRLSNVHPHVLLGAAQDAALGAVSMDPAELDLIVTGCVTKVGEQGYNVGRMASLASGLPFEVPAITLDAQCGSSHQAVNVAAAMISSGSAQVILASGVESMSRVPLGTDRDGPGDPFSGGYSDRYEMLTVGESAERIADRWGITRAECDRWALRSQERAAAATHTGAFSEEIVPIVVDGVEMAADEGIRVSPLEVLAGLRPSFRPDGAHSAASSSQVSDGAAAVLIMSLDRATTLGLTPLAAVTAHTIVGTDPILRLTGPIPVTERLLAATGMKVGDVDAFEINEAFASVVLAWLRETGADEETVNVLGGAIALGHPVGATGARLVSTTVHQMLRHDQETAMIAMCCGGGLGTGTVLSRI